MRKCCREKASAGVAHLLPKVLPGTWAVSRRCHAAVALHHTPLPAAAMAARTFRASAAKAASGSPYNNYGITCDAAQQRSGSAGCQRPPTHKVAQGHSQGHASPPACCTALHHSGFYQYKCWSSICARDHCLQPGAFKGGVRHVVCACVALQAQMLASGYESFILTITLP